MKKLFGLLTMLILVGGMGFAQTNSPAKTNQQTPELTSEKIDSLPKMVFQTNVVDFGVIEQGTKDDVRKVSFTNEGLAPLIISGARGSCGCTVPSYQKEPIMPGESSEISVKYATNRVGPINKTVTITTNEGGAPHKLVVKGKVNRKAKEPVSVPSSPTNIITDQDK